MFFNVKGFFAQEHAPVDQGGHHDVPFQKPDELVADTIVWVSVIIVLITLVLTLKYLFKPKENNPNHIKNIVKDEGF